MNFRTHVVALLALALVAPGCATPPKPKPPKMQPPEKDPWTGYSGRYNTAAEADKALRHEWANDETIPIDPASTNGSESKEAGKTGLTSGQDARKPSKGTIQGESVSVISADDVGSASSAVLNTTVLSSKVAIGAKYEQVEVKLKGATVLIIRPARAPDASGPAVATPKSRKGKLSAAESGWYDEEADVLVVVNAGRKAGSEKLLGSILKR